MMGCTDRHCRVLHRLLAPSSLTYSEMAVTGALIHGDSQRILDHHASDQPCAFQLGGSDPHELSLCARMVEDAGYQEVNLNVGCPSDRVQSGKFGACLMAEAQLVAECIQQMQQAVNIPVTVKCRIGIDDHDSYEFFRSFVDTVAAGGCTTFIVHARIAKLKGLSPKDNRQIPPLKYDFVYRLKKEYPALKILLNGGINQLSQIDEPLQRLDGIMIGREAYHNPWFLAQLHHQLIDSESPLPDRHQVLASYMEYIQEELSKGQPLQYSAKHLLGLFQGLPGARKYRRHLSEHMYKSQAGLDTIRQAASHVASQELIEC
jgi:tRNA-dihydrouridine synthase A